ncbi:hypothetical protein KKC00_00605 [Patescibacteria group bacterium]|nr:hypothetical protein [Patescibacteria group bacterium]
MKRIFVLSLLVITGLFSFGLAKAVEIANPIAPNNINELVTMIADGVALIIGPVALIMFIVGGIMFLVSFGNPEKINQAKACLIYAVIGAAIALAAKGLAAIIGNVFK